MCVYVGPSTVQVQEAICGLIGEASDGSVRKRQVSSTFRQIQPDPTAMRVSQARERAGACDIKNDDCAASANQSNIPSVSSAVSKLCT
jgi:hypothetical protein